MSQTDRETDGRLTIA